MRLIPSVAGLALLGLAAVLALAQLPELERLAAARRSALAVLTPLRVERLSGDNLADAMVSLPLHNRLIRVGWDHAILSADLAVRPDGEQPAVVWRDVETLIRFSFARVSNVRQLLIRVYGEPERSGAPLLLAADARSADWTADRLAALRAPETWPDAAWQRQLRLVMTPRGRQWLADAAGRPAEPDRFGQPADATGRSAVPGGSDGRADAARRTDAAK